MSKNHIDRALDELRRKLLNLSEIVEDSVIQSVQAFVDKDAIKAKKVRDRDTKIDELEVEIEEECLKLLALHQPVATDLRYIVATLKMNNDLERIGDLAANICSRTIRLIDLESVEPPFDIRDITKTVQGMVRKSIRSLIESDPELSRTVLSEDSAVDTEYKKVFNTIQKRIEESPKDCKQIILYLSVMRHLERIADLSTNIAEDVIYFVEGKIVRHGRLEVI